MKREANTEPGLPSVFELAQIAAQYHPKPGKEGEAVRAALSLWQAAGRELLVLNQERAEQLAALLAGIFTMDPKEWRARLADYHGDANEVTAALSRKKFSTDSVCRQLWKDKNLTQDTRRKFLIGLARASVRYEIEAPKHRQWPPFYYLDDGGLTSARGRFPIHPRNVEAAERWAKVRKDKLVPANEVQFVELIEQDLAQREIDGNLARWAFEVRQRQLAASKSRYIPTGAAQSTAGDADAGIQYKKPHRQ